MSVLDQALEAFRNGKPVIIMDDDKRENEGDLCVPAAGISDSDVLFFNRYTAGPLCVALNPLRADELNLHPMLVNGTDPRKTPFTISVDLGQRHGTTTGASVQDKVKTIRALADRQYLPADFSRPGHTFPLRASPAGLYGRQGHTEASVELCKLAGVYPACAISELINPNGTMSRLKECQEFSATHKIPLITVRDIQDRISMNSATLPVSLQGGIANFQISTFSPPTGEKYVILHKGDLHGQSNVHLRIHSECLTGDIFRSARCDCSSQLQAGLEMLHQSELGLLIYIRGQEGRGIGLENKIKAYSLQDDGHDTYSANRALHLPPDCRQYQGVSLLLDKLAVKSVVLHTEDADKLDSLTAYVAKVVPLPGIVTPQNRDYLLAKAAIRRRKRIGIVYTTAWHTEHVQHMVEQCRTYLNDVEVTEQTVSGSFELIMGAQFLFEQGCQSVIILGILLKGETDHFEAILSAVSTGAMSLQLKHGKPVTFGVLACRTQEQIEERVRGKKNAVKEWCKTAVEMVR